MKCPKCRTENPETQRFCGDCGTALALSGTPEVSVTRTIETGVEELARGTTFAGRYEIVEELGVGGMGRVYRAFDKKLQEDVALKLIRPDVAANRKTVERFHNEIKIARRITHKNVCRTHDLHEEGKTLFLTMEFVRGEDLRSLIHRTKVLSIGTAVCIARQVAEGLAEAHKLGIVHRDLKPGNIMIDKDGQAKIMDFGIARSLLGKGLTGEGAIVGTPEYMSPEQVEGKETDQRSDLYALGIILFEMVLGRPPFEGETPFLIANKHKTEPPPIPKKIIPQIPDELNKLILRCLEKDKTKRYQTAEELAADLAAIEQSLPSTDRALTQSRTKIRTSREITVKLTPRKIIIPAVVIIVLAIAAIVSLTLLKPARGKIDSIAVIPLEDLSRGKGFGYSVDQIHDQIINEMCKIPSIRITARRSVLRYKSSDLSYSDIARELKVAAIVEASVIQEEERIKITVSLIDGRSERRIWGPKTFERNSSDMLNLGGDIALRIAREIDAKLAPQNVAALTRNRKVNREAFSLYYRAKYGERDKEESTETYMKRRVDLLRQSLQIDPNFALGRARYAMAMHDLVTFGYYSPASEGYELARQAALKAIERDDSLPEAHEALGLIMFYQDWDFDGVEKEYRKSMVLAPGWTGGAWYMYLTLTGRFDEALAMLKRANEADPLYTTLPAQAFALLMARRYDEAIATADSYLKTEPKSWYVRKILSVCYALNDRCSEAISETEKILAGVPSVESDADTLYQMAFNYAHCGEIGKAKALLEAFNKTSVASEDPAGVAWIYAALGEKELALSALEKGVAARSPLMPYLKVDPILDSLRDDPRFNELLRKIGFEK